MVALADIEAASSRLAKVRVHTPLFCNDSLDAIAAGAVLLKPECLQVTGSFKIRGAYNRLSQLTKQQAARGVVAWSSGNHAQGVAAAGTLLGIKTAIVMPEDAPRAKLTNTRRLGGEVITYDRYSGDREVIARQLAAERGAALVPSYDHEHVIAGQGTVGLEMAADAKLRNLSLDQVLIPCGGGGLSSGSAVALKAAFPDCEIYAVEPRDFDDTRRSFVSGKRERVVGMPQSICDALQTNSPGELTFAINRRHLAGVLTVSDKEVAAAMVFAFKHLKLVVEPGGAVALAALIHGQVQSKGKVTGVVLSGGNVDTDQFARIQAELD